MDNKNITIKVRGVIVHDSKLLIVKHLGDNFMALPGGHLKYGEDVLACLKREIVEELGVVPEIGRLLYINTFIEAKKITECVEFFFEIKNGKDYLDIEKLERTHAHELSEIMWVSQNDDIEILPIDFGNDFKNNNIDFNKTKFISKLKF